MKQNLVFLMLFQATVVNTMEEPATPPQVHNEPIETPPVQATPNTPVANHKRKRSTLEPEKLARLERAFSQTKALLLSESKPRPLPTLPIK